MSSRTRRSPALKVVGQQQPDHVMEVQLGGAPRPPSVPGRKVVHRFPGARWLRSDVPATRADCPVERPCPHVACEHHLWVTAGEDRVGRPTADRKRPAVLEAKSMTTCALDVEDLGERSTAEIGAALGTTDRNVRYTLSNAIKKLKAMRVTMEELRELL